ncbi:MAG: transposase [Candidatus Berkelbacteria bacterium]|nr:transposase [Candidatus Berkelbacteria bacterium]MCR4308044.1 transposase [Candidatus Berkelbacteria bacterium]
MHSLCKDRITELFVLVDNTLEKRTGAGRPGLAKSEVVTILVWNALTENQHLLKDIHACMKRHYQREFPHLPGYSAFVDQCHEALPELHQILTLLLDTTAPVRWLDSTMVPVCREHRIDTYKVAKELVGLGKNHQGWWYGFKLHGSINQLGQFCALALTSADVYDGHMSKKLTNNKTVLAVGDTSYGGRAQTEPLRERNGTIFVAVPHPKKNKQLLAIWQKQLLDFRSKIECVWDRLKEHMGLVTSFPRSATGYLVHYLPLLIGYQLSVV